MYGRSLIFILFLLFGCQDKPEQSNFYKETSKRWLAATHISWINEHYPQDEKILRPKATLQPIMQINFIDRDFNAVSDCLFYYVPDDGDNGELKIVANKTNSNCKDLIAEKPYSTVSGIINFGYEYNEKIKSEINLTLKIDTERYNYNFLNATKNEYSEDKLSSSVKKKKYINGTITSSVSYNLDQALIKDGEICYDIADNCNELIRDKCSRCQHSFFQVVATKCKNKFRRICGKDKCGSRNNPACLRGYKAAGISPENYCINGSPLGICQEGLKVVCVNNTLMCE